jgi:large subunit ribosomal protein L35
MPKMKTHSGSKKRFRLTATGKVRGRSAFSSHILEKKSPKRKRRLGRPAVIAKSDERRVKELLGEGRRSRPGRRSQKAGQEAPRGTS